MIVNLTPLTPFLVKSGSDLSLLDLLERDNALYRIDTDFLAGNLSERDNEKLAAIMDRFAGEKKRAMAASPRGGRNRTWGKPDPPNFEPIWKDLQALYNSESLGKFVRVVGPAMAFRSRRFTKNALFSDYAHIDYRSGESREAVPYIPGSTIKGSISRGIIFNYLQKRPRKGNGRFILSMDERGSLRDLMSFIQVTDFYPLGAYSIEMSELIGERRKADNGIPLVTGGTFSGDIGIGISVGSSLRMEKKLRSTLIKMLLMADEWKSVPLPELGKRIVMQIIRHTSSYVEGVVRKHKEYYPAIAEGSSYMDIGFGKGISMTGFVEYKQELNIGDAVIKRPAVSHYLFPQGRLKLGLMRVDMPARNLNFVEGVAERFETARVK